MKKRIGILVLMGLVAINTLYSTAFAKELKTINRDLHDKSIILFSDGDPKPW
ncbi:MULTISPECIES: hypothetical protein [unclassified Clostridium]|uniref:hypothetical protein n=1 Tax=unclassified Clostridium TaxID=2614128 RepID=UPI0025B9A539|nr:MULTISPECIES: hypothetical protein [unclassified Clostridium]